MESISRGALQSLLSDTVEGPHVSIYMPAVRAGQQTLQNPIRFKNLTREAEGYLRERGMNKHEAAVFLETALRMIDDEEFWQHQDAGLAVFVAEGLCKCHRVPVELPERVIVEDRFYIKPLLPALSEGECFHVLTLSQNRVRLFDCDRHGAREIDLKDVPRSLADALGYELTQPDLSFHGGVSPGGGQPPSHQGEVASGYEKDSKTEVHQFLERLNGGLKTYLYDGRPLVLAGVEYLLPIYQQITDYQPIVGTITGNFDVARPATVHEKAWPVVEPYFSQAQEDALARYAELYDTDRGISGLEEIVIAAAEGRVDTLFVARGVQCWGRFNAAERKIDVHSEPRIGDEELLDLAAANTLLQGGGRVFMLPPEQVPGGRSQAAILRY